MNFDRPCVRSGVLRRAVLAAAALLIVGSGLAVPRDHAGAAEPAKINMVYVDDAPAPLGGVQGGQIAGLVNSVYTHIVFGFLSVSCHHDGADGICQEGQTPTLKWNGTEVGPPSPTVKAAIGALTEAGKTVLISVGGANQSTWANIGGIPIKVADELARFAIAYGMDGIDLNYRGHSGPVFLDMVEGLAGLLKPNGLLLTISPTGSDAVEQYTRLTTVSVYPDLVNVRFYGDGYTAHVPRKVAEIVELLTSYKQNKFSLDSLVVGLAPSSDKVPKSKANCANTKHYTNCASILREVFPYQSNPQAGGVFVWYYGGIRVYDWAKSMEYVLYPLP